MLNVALLCSVLCDAGCIYGNVKSIVYSCSSTALYLPGLHLVATCVIIINIRFRDPGIIQSIVVDESVVWERQSHLHARTHARTHARSHARTHTHTHTCSQIMDHRSKVTAERKSYWHIMPSVLWRCRLGVRKSIRPVEIEWWGVVKIGVVICLERGADCLHMVQLMPLPSQTPSSLASFKPDWLPRDAMHPRY